MYVLLLAVDVMVAEAAECGSSAAECELSLAVESMVAAVAGDWTLVLPFSNNSTMFPLSAGMTQ